MRLIAAHDYRRERWKNGLGWTSEIARGRMPVADSKPDATEDGIDGWDWRLSIADIDRDCAFSVFPGIDRSLRLLAGAGMRLRFGDGEVVDLGATGHQVDFAGERVLTCELVDGPTRDFNAMWRRDRVNARVTAQPLNGSIDLAIAPGETVAVLGLAGHLVADDHETHVILTEGETLIAGDMTGSNVRLLGDAMLLVARFKPLPRR